MNRLRRAIFGTFLGTLLLLSLTTALAQAEDPPGRVARLQYMSGSVSIQPRGTEDWVEGALNRPLTTADNIWADKDSRAELNAGTGVLRISSETSLTLTNVSDNTVQVQLHQGTLNLRVRKLYGGEVYEVDTPNLAFTVQKSGVYRFDVDPAGDATLVTVWKGEGDATGDGPAVRVHANERVRFTGGTTLANEISRAPSSDGFDDWCRVRDQREDHSLSARYVSPEVIGSEDLDEHGVWREEVPYGRVWVPTVEPGWAPYRYGHWAWIDPWGWTWVDDAEWGFAPFHYGRWVYTGGYWGWAPGPYYARPFYAPALVAWFGGPGWGVGFGFGDGFGWCPLGFGEPFFPWYGAGRGYFQSVNINNTRITNITNITNNYYNNRNRPGRPVSGTTIQYANLRAPGGVTAVSQHAIQNSLPVARNAIRVSAREFEKAPLRGNLALTPTRESRLGVNAGRPSAMPPARTFARPVVSRMAAPSAPARVGRTEMASLNKVDRPNAGGITARQSAVASPAPGRAVPRPPKRTENSNSGLATGRIVPRPPIAGASRSGPAPSTSARAVPRPTDGARVAPPARSSSPSSMARTTGREVPQPGERSSVPRPAQGSVPRPTQQVGSAPRAPESGNRPSPSRPSPEQRSVPRPSQSSPHDRAVNAGVPRPTGRVQPSRYDSGREYGARSAAPSSLPRSGGYSGAPPRSYEGSRGGSYGQSPRYSAPSSSRGYSPAPSYRGSAPAYHGSAPAYHSSSGSYHGSSGGYSGGGHSGGGGGSSHSSGGQSSGGRSGHRG